MHQRPRRRGWRQRERKEEVIREFARSTLLIVVNGSIHSFTSRASLFCQRQIYTPPLEGGPHRTPPLRPYTRRMRR